jgi:hypothetical protein
MVKNSVRMNGRMSIITIFDGKNLEDFFCFNFVKIESWR